jgi:hypothetical protein
VLHPHVEATRRHPTLVTARFFDTTGVTESVMVIVIVLGVLLVAEARTTARERDGADPTTEAGGSAWSC